MQTGFERATILISGRVQGVFFRRRIKRFADKLGVTGEAGNEIDGTVQVVAEGTRDKLEEIIHFSYSGNPLSYVRSFSVTWSEANNSFTGFSILRKGSFIEDKISALKNLSQSLLTDAVLPKHVVLIPDGNRRWAKSNKLEAHRGHTKGISNFTSILEEALRLKIPYLTAWGFSTENWKRSRQEVGFLMDIFGRYLDTLKNKVFEHQVQFRHFGRKDRLPRNILEKISLLERETAGFSKSYFGLALDYGGRDEVIRAIGKCKMDNGEVTEENFSRMLDTHGFPDPDLIIRTSGEQRMSGIMPWQSAYAELYFTPVYFPDFGVLEFQKAIADYSRRKRNFGG